MDLIIWEDGLILSTSWMETSHSFPLKNGESPPPPQWHTTPAVKSRLPSSHFFIFTVHASGMFYPWIRPLCNTSATGLRCQLPNLFPCAVLLFLQYKFLFLNYPSAGSSKLLQNIGTWLSTIISQNTLIFILLPMGKPQIMQDMIHFMHNTNDDHHILKNHSLAPVIPWHRAPQQHSVWQEQVIDWVPLILFLYHR